MRICRALPSLAAAALLIAALTGCVSEEPSAFSTPGSNVYERVTP